MRAVSVSERVPETVCESECERKCLCDTMPLHRNDALEVEWLKRQKRFPAKAENRGVVVTEAGSYLRLIDSCMTQLQAQGHSRTCNESKEEEDVPNVNTASNSLFGVRSSLLTRFSYRCRPLGSVLVQVQNRAAV